MYVYNNICNLCPPVFVGILVPTYSLLLLPNRDEDCHSKQMYVVYYYIVITSLPIPMVNVVQ